MRIDTVLRAAVDQAPTPENRSALAALLIQHHAAEEGLSVLPGTGRDDLRWVALRQLGRPPDAAVKGALAARGQGPDAFVAALLGGWTDAASAIADRTPGTAGSDLRAELQLRHGKPPKGPLSPLNDVRRSFLAGELSAAAARGLEVEGPDRAEAALVAVGALRRLGQVSEARDALRIAEQAPGRVLPGVALERALLRLVRASIQLRGMEDISAIRWAYGGRPTARSLWPRIWWMRHRLLRFSREVGPFRGEVLTRCIQGRVVPVHGADVPRSRAALLRTALQVQPLDAVLARFAQLGARHDQDHVVRMYAAEVLHWVGRHEEAGAMCARTLADDPSSRWSWIGLLEAQMWTGEVADARRTLAQLRERHPHLPTIPAVEGELMLVEGDAHGALPHLAQAVRNHSTRWAAHVLVALAQARAGQRDAASVTLERLRALAPGAFHEGTDVEAVLSDHLRSLRGNRSSGFVTRVSADGTLQLLTPAALNGLRAMEPPPC